MVGPSKAASAAMTVDDIVCRLGLVPHPEGGFYRETFRDPRVDGRGRSVSTAIYYLLGRGDESAWHRVDASEVWHFYVGAPLALTVSLDRRERREHVLGSGIMSGQVPQVVVPSGCWQRAVSLGDWTLVGCTVAPGFEFAGFEMAPR
jgi:hypothetical protein